MLFRLIEAGPVGETVNRFADRAQAERGCLLETAPPFPTLLTPSELAYQGIAAEGAQPGYYGTVIEGGAFPHGREKPFARRHRSKSASSE